MKKLRALAPLALLVLACCGAQLDIVRRNAEAEQAVKNQVAPIVLGEKPVPVGQDREAMRALMETWQMRIDASIGAPR